MGAWITIGKNVEWKLCERNCVDINKQKCSDAIKVILLTSLLFFHFLSSVSGWSLVLLMIDKNEMFLLRCVAYIFACEGEYDIKTLRTTDPTQQTKNIILIALIKCDEVQPHLCINIHTRKEKLFSHEMSDSQRGENFNYSVTCLGPYGNCSQCFKQFFGFALLCL